MWIVNKGNDGDLVIKFGNFGQHLGPRSIAATQREKIAAAIRSKSGVTIDFEGVITMSDSFADECFGKLNLDFNLHTIKNSIQLKNASPLITNLFHDTIRERNVINLAF